MTHEDEPLEPKTLEHKSEGAGLDEEVPFDDFESGGGIRAMLDKNPALKIVLIVVAIILVVILFLMFGKGNKTPVATSTIRAHNAGVAGLTGNGQVSPEYQRAIQDQNAQDVEQALKSHGSAIPVGLTPSVAPAPALPAQVQQEDPLERWRQIERDRAKQDQAATTLPSQQQQQDPNAQAVKELATAMSQQMQSILSSIKPTATKHQNVTEVRMASDNNTGGSGGSGGGSGGFGGGNGGGGTGGANGSSAPADVNIIEPAGAIVYGQLITEANSDVNGPVVAEIVGGPLAGNRMIGTFNKVEDTYLVLQFNTVIIAGIGHSTTAYAVDPATNLTGIPGDVDHKYFDRIVIPGAAAFIQGLGQAVEQTGSTVDVSDSSTLVATPKLNVKQQVFAGISSAAQQAGSVLTQDANQQQVQVKVPAGTPIGILFTAPVTDQQQ